MSDLKKFLDQEGVKHLWSRISMEDYPNNETLMAIINAIDQTKADKDELIQNKENFTDKERYVAKNNLHLTNNYNYVHIGKTGNEPYARNYYIYSPNINIEIAKTVPAVNASTVDNALVQLCSDLYVACNGNINTTNYSLVLPRLIQQFNTLKDNGACQNSFYLYCYYKDYNQSISETICIQLIYQSNNNSYTILKNSISMLRFKGDTYEIFFNSMCDYDKTLSLSDKPAEAKAVGDALALKVNKNELIQSDWNQIDETQMDYIKNKPQIATDEEIIEMLMEEDMFPIVTDSDGAILADENNNILLW